MHLLLSLIPALLMAACSSTPPTPTPTQWLDNSQLQHWQISGKLGLRGPEFAESAYINWRQCERDFHIRLNGPLGSGAVELSGNPQLTTLTTSDQQVYQADTPQTLLYQQLGWQVPVSELLFWLRGMPAPGNAIQQQEQGFSQNGWTIRYLRHITSGPYQLPGKLIAEHPQLKVTLIIKHWQLQPKCP